MLCQCGLRSGRSVATASHTRCSRQAYSRRTLIHEQFAVPNVLHTPIRIRVVYVSASRQGFGGAKRQGGSKPKQRPNKSTGAPIPPQRQPGTFAPDIESLRHREEDDSEFTLRLARLKKQAAEVSRAAAASTLARSSSSPSPLDPEPDIYVNPPSLVQTLAKKYEGDISDPALRDASIGPGKLAAAAGALVFALVFLVATGADFTPRSKRYSGLQPSTQNLDPIEQSTLKAQAAKLEEAVRSKGDVDSAEQLAMTYVQLGDYRRAADALTRVTEARPGDADAWRVLGEAALLNAQAGRSVDAYIRAAELRRTDLRILTGLTNALIANGEQRRAVELLAQRRQEVQDTLTRTAPALQAGVVAAGANESQESPADVVAVDLLRGKAYAAWRGHDSDALAVYDDVISSTPEDFRAYLAKGLFLKEHGRQADAERMLMQARFYAPQGRRDFVTASSKTETLVDLPSDE